MLMVLLLWPCSAIPRRVPRFTNGQTDTAGIIIGYIRNVKVSEE